jgi:hypothetical protein
MKFPIWPLLGKKKKVTVSIFSKRDFLRNSLKKKILYNQNQMNNKLSMYNVHKTETPFFAPYGLLFGNW